MKVEPVRLEGETVRLEPLTLDHVPGLFHHADPEIFRLFVDWPLDPTLEGFRAWIAKILTLPDCLDFATVLKATGEPVGATAYLEIRPAHDGLEIGRTWIARAHQGTRINPEAKYLLLRHAFETLGAERVQLKTDLNNVHSQRAIEKLGARREGVLRRYQKRANGRIRDTVVYSVIAEEWPAVKAGLEARLR
ncbi:MAG TPA: GNAT family protein [Thermoanaerobaculia bacterium]|nr:GNAT family protein [Thermoanaerobaculia bacterium]